MPAGPHTQACEPARKCLGTRRAIRAATPCAAAANRRNDTTTVSPPTHTCAPPGHSPGRQTVGMPPLQAWGDRCLGARQRKGRKGVHLVASDRGPGIEDVEQAITDHFSTGGTLGLGLSGARRMMDEFIVTSEPGAGTRVEVVKWN